MNNNTQLRDTANTELTYAKAIINLILDSGFIDNENTLNTLAVALLSVIRGHEALIKINLGK
ncbi:MAG: hypothetical protein KA732_20860 [Providencia sp.]|uniref:hypothetical protein n=1 Tax=Providencia sp. TaxID=589 RepID=UPI001B3E63EB|nr:hypothetical protein [Providencia sp.]